MFLKGERTKNKTVFYPKCYAKRLDARNEGFVSWPFVCPTFGQINVQQKLNWKTFMNIRDSANYSSMVKDIVTIKQIGRVNVKVNSLMTLVLVISFQ